MAVNRYPGSCRICGANVPALGGQLQKIGGVWTVAHLACMQNGSQQVVEFRFNSGAVVTRNVKGLCEDAPACGCCSV